MHTKKQMFRCFSFLFFVLLNGFVNVNSFVIAQEINESRYTGRTRLYVVKQTPEKQIVSDSLRVSPNLTGNKWNDELKNELGERIESVKTGIASALGGSLAVLPYDLLKGLFVKFDAPWEFNLDRLAIILVLFGITYRYCIRKDNNVNLKQGVVGAFAITKALGTIQVPSTCSSIPLECGPPFHLFSTTMLFTGLESFFEAGLALAGSAYVLEQLFELKILSKFPKV